LKKPKKIMLKYLIFAGMKKLSLLLLVAILCVACNRAVCPAYSDSVNKMTNTVFQKGSYRANGIDRIYRDAYQKKSRK
jgi:hypothetical protein